VPTTYAKAFAADVQLMRWIKGEPPSQRAFVDVVDLLSEANPQAFAEQKLGSGKKPVSGPA
jgi:hypothetical protein